MPTDPPEQENDGQNQVATQAPDQNELENLLDSIPPELLMEAIERRGGSPGVMAARITTWQAPLPPADMLRQYEEISPGFADRIISSSEREQDHRHGCEKSALGASIGAERRGQYMALGIAVIMIATSAFLIWSDHAVAGSIFGGVTLLGLVALFHGRTWKFWRKDEEADGSDEKD